MQMQKSEISLVLLLVQYSLAPVQPVGAAEIDQNNDTGERPGAYIGQAKHRQGVDSPENRNNPQNAESAYTEPNNNYRAKRIA